MLTYADNVVSERKANRKQKNSLLASLLSIIDFFFAYIIPAQNAIDEKYQCEDSPDRSIIKGKIEIITVTIKAYFLGDIFQDIQYIK